MPEMDDLGRRVRAARGYAGMNQPELGRRLGVSTATVKRLEGGVRTLRGFERQAFIAAVADATGLPQRWFEGDVASAAGGAPSEAPPADPLAVHLERVATRLEDALAELRVAQAQLAGAPAAEPGAATEAERVAEATGALAEPLEDLARATGQPRESAPARSAPTSPRQVGRSSQR